MFCSNCGTQIPEGSLFCGNCGAKVEAQPAPQPAPQPAYEAVQQPAYEAVQQPAYQAVQEPVYVAPQQPVQVAPVVNNANDPELNSLATNTMIFGIIGLALSELGVPGIILSSIAMNKAAEFESKAGSLYGKAKVGRRLAKPGKIVGIIMTIFWAIYTLVLIFAMA